VTAMELTHYATCSLARIGRLSDPVLSREDLLQVASIGISAAAAAGVVDPPLLVTAGRRQVLDELRRFVGRPSRGQRKPRPISLDALTGRDGEPLVDVMDVYARTDPRDEAVILPRVARAIASLPRAQRAVVDGLLAGLTQADLMRQLGITDSGVNLNYRHARENIRRRLGLEAA